MSDILTIASSLNEKVQMLQALTLVERAACRAQIEQLAADLVTCCGIEPNLGNEARKIEALVARLFDRIDFNETAAAVRQAVGQFVALL